MGRSSHLVLKLKKLSEEATYLTFFWILYTVTPTPDATGMFCPSGENSIENP
jgi:hypothetical protein